LARRFFCGEPSTGDKAEVDPVARMRYPLGIAKGVHRADGTDRDQRMKIILAIAAGGAFGAVARHFVNNQITHWMGDGFPWGILFANVAGSFALGVLAESMALVWSPSQELRAFMIVGVLGAFTTFSTFTLQVALLYERGQMLLAAGYVAASVVFAVGGLFAGLALVRTLAV
jgi:CrcB protein